MQQVRMSPRQWASSGFQRSITGTATWPSGFWVDTQKTQLFCDFKWGPYYYKPDCSSLPFLPAEDQALAAGLGLTYS